MSVLGTVVVVAVLAVATVAGLVRRRTAGVLRPAATVAEPAAPPAVSADDLGQPLGDRATLVQFSSAFCRPCVSTRHVLAAVAAELPGVRHVEVDAESHLDLVRRLGVASTPTTLLLDAAGAERHRARGVPRREQVLGAISALG